MIFSLSLISLFLTIFEITLFVLLGHWIGWIKTILLALTTSFIGLSLVRLRLQQLWLSKRSDPTVRPENVILHGFMLHVAKILFLTPGFLTNLLGFILLFAPGRSLVFTIFQKWFKRLFSASPSNGSFNSPNGFKGFYHFEFPQSSRSNGEQPNDYNSYNDFNSIFSQKMNQNLNSSIQETLTAKENVENGKTRTTNDQEDDIIDVEFEIKPK